MSATSKTPSRLFRQLNERAPWQATSSLLTYGLESSWFCCLSLVNGPHWQYDYLSWVSNSITLSPHGTSRDPNIVTFMDRLARSRVSSAKFSEQIQLGVEPKGVRKCLEFIAHLSFCMPCTRYEATCDKSRAIQEEMNRSTPKCHCARQANSQGAILIAQWCRKQCSLRCDGELLKHIIAACVLMPSANSVQRKLSYRHAEMDYLS
jgi:hypothetical protein